MSEIKVYDAGVLEQNEWLQLQTVSRESFAGTLLNRPLDEIDALVQWNDPDLFYKSHVDPNTQVGQRYNANQSFSRPRVAVATEGGELAGFAYSAYNVSGASGWDRFAKRLSVVKNYLWLREVAVKPEFQQQGIATSLGRALLRDTLPIRPPTTYVWPDEIAFLQSALERVGFVPTGEQQVTVFGENSIPIRQVRLQAPSARSVLQQLKRA